MSGCGKRHICVVLRSAPHGTIRGQEGLEAVLMASAFEQRLSVVFVDDGVFLLMSDQRPQRIGAKNFASAFKALEMYGVDEVIVERASLERRRLAAGDLMVPVTALESAEIASVLEGADTVMSF